EDAVAALADFEPAPPVVIASGTGSNCHLYWPLSTPLGRDEVERANRRLAYALGADPAATDASRILRVPATTSWKHDPPTAYEAAERGWYWCGAWRRGGTIYDLAAPLYFSGQSPEVLPRGERFIEVRARLMAMFFPAGAC